MWRRNGLMLVAVCCWCWGSVTTVSSFTSPSLPKGNQQFRVVEFNRWQQKSELKTLAATLSRHKTTQLYSEFSTASFKKRVKGGFSRVNEWRAKYWSKARHLAVTVFMVAVVLGMSTGLRPAHAASTAVTNPTLQERIHNVIPKGPSLDTMINRYVKKHMFDDDAHDPTSSAYREAFHDNVEGVYPSALREVTSSVLGESGASKSFGTQGADTGVLGSLIKMLQKRGINEVTAIAALTTMVFLGAPVVFLFGTMTMGLFFKRNINREMKKRYGDGYTLDATIKVEEEVEAPDDDEIDNDDDDDADKSQKNK